MTRVGIWAMGGRGICRDSLTSRRAMPDSGLVGKGKAFKVFSLANCFVIRSCFANVIFNHN
jgi:hypothetical protein